LDLIATSEPWSAIGVSLYCIRKGDITMNGIIYLVGLVVIIMFILSFLGLR
jgi:hypothetical protein